MNEQRNNRNGDGGRVYSVLHQNESWEHRQHLRNDLSHLESEYDKLLKPEVVERLKQIENDK